MTIMMMKLWNVASILCGLAPVDLRSYYNVLGLAPYSQSDFFSLEVCRAVSVRRNYGSRQD